MRDEYLENLYLTLEMCNLTIQNAGKFCSAVVKKAEEIKMMTEEEIRFRQLATMNSFRPGCPCRFKDCDNCNDYKDCPGSGLPHD